MKKLSYNGALWVNEVSHKAALEELQRRNVALLADLQDAKRLIVEIDKAHAAKLENS